MVSQGKTTSQFPQKGSLYDANDCFVIVYAIDTANSSNTGQSQTALVSAQNLFANTPLTIIAANLQCNVAGGDPIHSNSLTIQQGTIWATNSYIYVAVSNNTVLRAALTSF
jgi:hypothetical protein